MVGWLFYFFWFIWRRITRLALRWMWDSPWTGCVQRIIPIYIYMYVVWTRHNIMILSGDLYCRLLLQCEALRTSHSGFPIATNWCCDQDVKGYARCSLHKKNMRLVQFVEKRRKCCCNFTVRAARLAFFRPNFRNLALFQVVWP